MEPNPGAIVIFSGKRKSGKDYVTDIVQSQISKAKCSILRLSGPLKRQYAKDHGLDYERLLDATEYKEFYRADMIKWGEDQRNKDPGYFCRLACQGKNVPDKGVWIISDARRKSDIKYFQDKYPGHVITVRVQATEDTRKERGWVFKEGVDDADSECALDSGVKWDFLIPNNGDKDQLDTSIRELNLHIEEKISKS